MLFGYPPISGYGPLQSTPDPNASATDPSQDPTSSFLPMSAPGAAPSWMVPAASPIQSLPDPSAPVPQDAPSTAPMPITPLPRPVGNGLLDAIDSVLLGGRLASARNAGYDARNTNYMNQALMQQRSQFLATLDPNQLAAYQADPAGFTAEWEKNYGPQTLKGGETGIRGGDSRTAYTAPLQLMDNGRGVSLTPKAMAVLGNTGPSFNADGLDTRGIEPQANFQRPVTVPNTDRLWPYNPNPTGPVPDGVTGGAFARPPIAPASPLVSSGSSGPAPTAAPSPMQRGSQVVPRGIRNNNPGNVRALPNGQMWAGQTATDPSGYAVFDSPLAGVHAALTNLNSYGAKDGVNTVEGLVSRWAPQAAGNSTSNYTTYVANALGVKPTDKIDLTDPAVQQKAATAIFQYENGPKAMQTLFPSAAAPASPGPMTAPTAGAPAVVDPNAGPAPPQAAPVPLVASGASRPMTPLLDAKPFGAAQTVMGAGGKQLPGQYQLGPDGKLTPVEGTIIPQADLLARQKAVLEDDSYKQAQAGLAAYHALVGNSGNMTGPAAYSILDTMARAINPGAVARPTVIQTIEQNLGIPAHAMGFILNAQGKGNLPKDIRQEIIDAVYPFVQSHYGQAAAMNAANSDWAKRNNVDPRDVTAPLEPMPQRFQMDAPPTLSAQDAAKLPSGTPFVTLDGRHLVRK